MTGSSVTPGMGSCVWSMGRCSLSLLRQRESNQKTLPAQFLDLFNDILLREVRLHLSDFLSQLLHRELFSPLGRSRSA